MKWILIQQVSGFQLGGFNTFLPKDTPSFGFGGGQKCSLMWELQYCVCVGICPHRGNLRKCACVRFSKTPTAHSSMWMMQVQCGLVEKLSGRGKGPTAESNMNGRKKKASPRVPEGPTNSSPSKPGHWLFTVSPLLTVNSYTM